MCPKAAAVWARNQSCISTAAGSARSASSARGRFSSTVQPVTLFCTSSSGRLTASPRQPCLRKKLGAIGRPSPSIRAQSLCTRMGQSAPHFASAASMAARQRERRSGAHTSSWSQRAAYGVRASCSRVRKLPAAPRCFSSSGTTANRGSSAARASSATVPSVEPSSRISTRKAPSVCPRRLASCSGRNRAPL